MFLIQNPTLISTLGSLHCDAQDRLLKSPNLRGIAARLQHSRSIGDLISLVRDPLGTTSRDGGHYDILGRPKEDVQGEDLKHKRHILYLRLQEVCRLAMVLANLGRSLTFNAGNDF